MGALARGVNPNLELEYKLKVDVYSGSMLLILYRRSL